MTIEMLENLIERESKIGLGRVVLTMDKPVTFRTNGQKLKTPFGLCEVCTFNQKEDRVQVGFFAEIEKIEKYIKKVRAQFNENK